MPPESALFASGSESYEEGTEGGGGRAEGMPQGTGWVRRWQLQPTLEAEQLKAPRRAAAVEGEGQVSVQAVGRSGSGGGSAGEREGGGRG